MMSKEIDSALNIAPDDVPSVEPEVLPAVTTVGELVEVSDKKEVDEDFEFARENIKEMIESGKDVFKEMMQVAKQSQHPRAYEVLGNLMKIAIESNKDLLNLRKQRKELLEKENDGPDVVNNNLVLSTAELLKLIRNPTNE
jgi:hypothetical protein